MFNADSLITRQDCTNGNTLNVGVTRLGNYKTRNCAYYGVAYLYCEEEIKEILCLITTDPTGGICRPTPIFRALFHSRALNLFAVKRDIQSLSDEFDRVLADGLVEIRVYLLWKTFMPQDLNEPRQ